jgi:hypothetical protein
VVVVVVGLDGVAFFVLSLRLVWDGMGWDGMGWSEYDFLFESDETATTKHEEREAPILLLQANE